MHRWCYRIVTRYSNGDVRAENMTVGALLFSDAYMRAEKACAAKDGQSEVVAIWRPSQGDFVAKRKK